MTTRTSSFVHAVLTELKSLASNTIWPITVGLMFVLTMLATGLGLGEQGIVSEGVTFDSGRNAVALTALVAMVLGIISGPVVLNSARKDDSGAALLGLNLVVGVAVGASLMLAAVPALLWGFTQSSLDFTEWLGLIATVKFEMLVATLIAALVHVMISRRTVAALVGGAIVLLLTVAPAVVSELSANLNSVKQTETYISVEYTEDTEIDPDTGIAIDPVCMAPNTITTWVSDPSAAWQIMAMSPLVTLAESLPAATALSTGSYYDPEFDDTVPMSLYPVDALSALSTQFHMSQKPVPAEILHDECAAAKAGEHLPYYYQDELPADWNEGTQSGWTIGIIVQSGVLVFVALFAAVAQVRRRRVH